MLIYSNLNQEGALAELRIWAQAVGVSIHDLGEKTPEIGPPGLLLTHAEDKVNLRFLKNHPSIQTIFPIRDTHLAEDLERLKELIQQPLETNSVHSIDSLLQHQVPDAERFHFEAKSSDDRWRLIEQLGDYVATKPVFETFPDMVRTIASELLTNAFYNAPRTAQGEAAQPDRNQKVQLTGKQVVEFEYGDDGKHIWLKVVDPFGTLQRRKLVEHLGRCSSQAQVTVSEGAGGAGIGLFMVYRWASQLQFVLEPHRHTTVMVRLLKTKRMRIFDSQRVVFEVLEARHLKAA